MTEAITDAVTGYAKPLPTLNDENRPFWQACKDGVLKLQKCSACGHVRYPINRYCPRCLSDEFEWAAMSGRGTVFSYIVFHQAYGAGFKADIPYNVALVQLEEGPRLFSNIVGVPNDQVKIGDEVQVTFDAVTDEITIPRFVPRKKN
jgi:uncharacterized OB-fold protein